MNAVNTKPYQIANDATWFSKSWFQESYCHGRNSWPGHSTVTGSSSGIGKALANQVAAQPDQKLVATARDPSTLSYLPDSPNVLKLTLDVNSEESVNKAFADAAAHFGSDFHIDVLVNNAGFSLSGDTANVTESQMKSIMETNFFGSVRCSIKAVENMRQHKSQRGGIIYQISSLAGVCAFPGHAFYHASKWAIEGFTESFAREMNPEWNSKHPFTSSHIHLFHSHDLVRFKLTPRPLVNFCIAEPASVKTAFETTSKQHIKQHPGFDGAEMPARKLSAMVEKGLKAGVGMDPSQIAKALWHVATRNQNIPFHLPLSSTAVYLMKMNFNSRLEMLEATSDLSDLDKDQAKFDIK